MDDKVRAILERIKGTAGIAADAAAGGARAAGRKAGQMVDVDYYNRSLMNQDMTLQLNLDGSVDITTTNNQRFLGSPAGNDLVVVYTSSTRSIPAQTTPARIVVLCPKTV